MFEFLFALMGYLTARLVWDFIRRMALRAGEMPIVWAAKTLALLAGLAVIFGGFGLAIFLVILKFH
jgi:NhaP-type Na+/H+ and K+/H+ antiporter